MGGCDRRPYPKRRAATIVVSHTPSSLAGCLPSSMACYHVDSATTSTRQIMAFGLSMVALPLESPQVTAMSGPFGGWSVSVSSFAPWGKATTFVRSAQRGGKG
jgi:hypothetical protein